MSSSFHDTDFINISEILGYNEVVLREKFKNMYCFKVAELKKIILYLKRHKQVGMTSQVNKAELVTQLSRYFSSELPRDTMPPSANFEHHQPKHVAGAQPLTVPPRLTHLPPPPHHQPNNFAVAQPLTVPPRPTHLPPPPHHQPNNFAGAQPLTVPPRPTRLPPPPPSLPAKEVAHNEIICLDDSDTDSLGDAVSPAAQTTAPQLLAATVAAQSKTSYVPRVSAKKSPCSTQNRGHFNQNRDLKLPAVCMNAPAKKAGSSNRKRPRIKMEKEESEVPNLTPDQLMQAHILMQLVREVDQQSVISAIRQKGDAESAMLFLAELQEKQAQLDELNAASVASETEKDNQRTILLHEELLLKIEGDVPKKFGTTSVLLDSKLGSASFISMVSFLKKNKGDYEVTEEREALVNILLNESKAIRWYNEYARAYLVRLAKRLESIASRTGAIPLNCLQIELKKLKNILYSMPSDEATPFAGAAPAEFQSCLLMDKNEAPLCVDKDGVEEVVIKNAVENNPDECKTISQHHIIEID